MKDTEFIYLLKEIISLKQTIAANETGGFMKSIISIIPAVIASVGTYLITKNIFDKTYKKEREFKIENDNKELLIKSENKEKELSEKHIEIYSNVFYLEDEIHSLLMKSYLYAIDSEYFHYLSELEEIGKEKEVELKRKSDLLYENHLNTMEKAFTSGGKFNKNVAEYYLLFPNTRIMELVDNIAETGIEFKPSKNFDFNMDNQELEEIKIEQSNELKLYISKVLMVKFNAIVNMIKLKQ